MKKHRRCKGFILILLGIAMILLPACGKKKREIAGSFGIIENIDRDSITTDGDYTNFNVVLDDGKTIRFQGKDIEITDRGIEMEIGALLCSLDYVGMIENLSIAGEGEDCWLNLGAAYANASSVDSMEELFMGFDMALVVGELVTEDISSYDAGFVALEADRNVSTLLLTELRVDYSTEIDQILYSDMKEDSEGVRVVKNFPPLEDEDKIINADELARMKMEEPDSITSDVIAGIDYSSIKKEGDSTFFSSQMSNEEVIRFEGRNIEIDEGGITIHPNSEITSLDAIGKIYVYHAQIKDAQKYMESSGESSSYESTLHIGYGYTYSDTKLSVDSAEEVHTYGYASVSPVDWEREEGVSIAYLEPNFVYFSGSEYNEEDLLLTSLSVGYNPNEKVTGIRDLAFDLDMTSSYLEGDFYNSDIEKLADISTGSLDFYLLLEPDTEYADLRRDENRIAFVPKEFYEVGDLKDAEGNVLDKKTARISSGTILEVRIGDYTVNMNLDTQEQYLGALTMNDLVPYAFPKALGEQHVLVVPVAWADQKEEATDTNLSTYKKALGRVENIEGKVTDYSDSKDKIFSLSEYFDLASYGQYEVTSFLTDWYYIDKTFEENEFAAPKKDYADEILEWVKGTYPEIDWSLYDQDGNGYIDSLILLNAGVSKSSSYTTISYGGAIHYRESYYGEYAGTSENPNVNCFVTLNQRFLKNGETSTLIHEYSHNLGLIDYYDVDQSGINAVGGFDMQSDNKGDWNAYSKMAVGWIEPQVVAGLASGESVELTIEALSQKGDAIVIPAVGKEYEGPFSEYIMVDLFSSDGVNTYDSEEYGLEDAVGVRISHVDARMEKRTMKVESEVNLGEMDTYTIGTVHYANNYKADGRGYYNIEVIQAGKKNTFTNPESGNKRLSTADLFYAGDEFSVEEYNEFFYQSLMNDGSEFGYNISVVRIEKNADGTPSATIKITAK